MPILSSELNTRNLIALLAVVTTLCSLAFAFAYGLFVHSFEGLSLVAHIALPAVAVVIGYYFALDHGSSR